MTKKLDSDALGDLNRALGLSGAGSRLTELEDGQVDQVIEISNIARRGRTLAGTGGIYTAILRNIHTDAEAQTSTATPYNIALPADRAPWPIPTSRRFDIWLLGASVRRISGSGSINAQLLVAFDASQQAWGFDDSAVVVQKASRFALGHWNSFLTAGTRVAGGLVNGNTFLNIGIRLPRNDNTQLEFVSASSATMTLECDMILGLFPVGFGQDVKV